MGEAKRRGSFEERKANAIAKKDAEPPKRPASAYRISPRGKSNVGLLLAAALAASAMPLRGRQRKA